MATEGSQWLSQMAKKKEPMQPQMLPLTPQQQPVVPNANPLQPMGTTTPRVGGTGPTTQPPAQTPAAPAGTAYGTATASPYAPNSLAGNAFGGSTSISQINPAQDLRSQQIAPSYGSGSFAGQADQFGNQAAGALGSGQVASSNYGQIQGLIDQIRSASAGAGAGGGGESNPQLDALKKQYTDSLSGLQGPDRNALANEAFGLMRSSSEPAFQQELRGVGQKAAALGRVGAGMTTNDLGTVQQRREEGLANAQKGLSLDAAGQSLNDKLAASQGIGQGYNTLSTQANNASIGRMNAGMAGVGGLRDALGYQFDLENLKRGEGESDRSYGVTRSGAYSGLADQAFGQGADIRNEYRGERDFQSGAAQQGVDNAFRQRMGEEDLQNSEYDRNMRTAGFYNQLGQQGVDEYAGAQGDEAARYEQQSADSFGDIGNFLAEYLTGQAGKKKPDPNFTGQ